MARIVRSNSQVDALRVVNEGVRRVQKIDSMLDEQVGTMSIKTEQSRLPVTDTVFTRQVLKNLKQATIRDVKAMSNKFSIELSKEEQAILGLLLKEQEQEVELPQEQEQEAELPELSDLFEKELEEDLEYESN